MFLRFLSACFVSGLCSTIAFACMCGQASICDAYSKVDAVVVAEVVRYRPAGVPIAYRDASGTERIETEDGQEVTLSVSKWFKGSGSHTLLLSQPNSTCDWSFDSRHLKKRFLFYLVRNPANNQFKITSCGRSIEYDQADADLSWLEGLPNSLHRTYISGTTRHNDDSSTFPSLSNVPISVDGPESYRRKSNSKGFYEIWDAPPGKYRITATPLENMILGWTVSTPENWTYFWSYGNSDPQALDVTIEAKGCGGVDFMFKSK